MKQLLALCAVMTLMGCGTEVAPSEELGTLEAAVCGKSNCGASYRPSDFYCDGGCPNSAFCNTSFNAANCVAVDFSGPFSACVGNCPSGYHTTAISETADCRPGATSGASGNNRRECTPDPAPGAVGSYTVCVVGSTCASGYASGTSMHLDECYFAGTNAKTCVAVP